MNPFIFIPINGVLISTNSKKELYDKYTPLFNESCIQYLKNIIRETNGYIVLTSSYRLYEDHYQSIVNQLYDNDIFVYGKTPINKDYIRGIEIYSFLYDFRSKNNMHCFPPYIIIDSETDDIYKYHQMEFIYKIDPYTGITHKDSIQIIKELNLRKVGISNMLKNNIRTGEVSLAEYKEYVDAHIANVRLAYDSFAHDIVNYVLRYNRGVRYNGLLTETRQELMEKVKQLVSIHDASKYTGYEFTQYAARFYPCEEDVSNEKEVKENFKEAWKHHYTNNPHHPEYWKVADSEKEKYDEMSNKYFVEMILDWISVSITKKSSTYDWWFNCSGGRDEKQAMLTALDIKIIDDFLTVYKDATDFTPIMEKEIKEEDV